MYESITKNAIRYGGYQQSPDYHYQQEKLQRAYEVHWLKTRGKSAKDASNRGAQLTSDEQGQSLLI